METVNYFDLHDQVVLNDGDDLQIISLINCVSPLLFAFHVWFRFCICCALVFIVSLFSWSSCWCMPLWFLVSLVPSRSGFCLSLVKFFCFFCALWQSWQKDGEIWDLNYSWKKLVFALFKNIIQHFTIFPKLIREMSLFWNSIFPKSSKAL